MTLEKFVKGLSPEGRKAFSKMPKKDLNIFSDFLEGGGKIAGTVAEGGKKAIGSLKDSMTELLKPTENLETGFRALINSTKQYQEQNQKFFQAGYTGEMFDFSKSISKANEESLKLNATLGAGRKVSEAFRENTIAIALASDGLSDSLMEAGVVMQGAGFDMADFAKIVDTAAFSFNQNDTQIKNMTSTLINVQREIPVSADKLAKNFQSAQKNFAYSADKMMDNFIDLQKMSTTTGVGFDQLMSSFSGDGMDTFAGASEKAGKLNQILGRSAFNSMELLTMTEAERAKKVRGAIMESGRSIEDMGKFEILALGRTLGMDPATTRKFLRGDLKIDEAGAMKKIAAADPNAIKSRQLGDSLDEMRKGINRSRPIQDRYNIQLANISIKNTKLVLEQDQMIGKFKKMNLSMDQMLPAYLSVLKGYADPTGLRRDRTETTGLRMRDESGTILQAQEVIKKLPPVMQPFASIVGSIAAINNPTFVTAMEAMNKTFADVFTKENLDKLQKAMTGGQEITVLVKDMLGKTLGSSTTAPMKSN